MLTCCSQPMSEGALVRPHPELIDGIECVGLVLARFGHALSDPTRARLLLALREAPGYPAALADLLGDSRQNQSNHLSCRRVGHAWATCANSF